MKGAVLMFPLFIIVGCTSQIKTDEKLVKKMVTIMERFIYEGTEAHGKRKIRKAISSNGKSSATAGQVAEYRY